LSIAWEYPGKALEVIPAKYSQNYDPIPCTGMKMEVRIKTDNYPEETAWTLTNKCDAKFTLSSPQYSLSNVVQTTTKCIPRGRYEFTISDTFDDGICCNFGRGGYEILLNGIPRHAGGQFSRLEAKTFGTCPASEIVASRVRVQLEGRNYLHMRDVEVWGTNGTNVALNKAATQSSTYDAGSPASNAVNGIFTDWTHTGEESGK
jgi:hypothetical protein